MSEYDLHVRSAFSVKIARMVAEYDSIMRKTEIVNYLCLFWREILMRADEYCYTFITWQFRKFIINCMPLDSPDCRQCLRTKITII